RVAAAGGWAEWTWPIFSTATRGRKWSCSGPGRRPRAGRSSGAKGWAHTDAGRLARSAITAALPTALAGHDLLPSIGQPPHRLATNAGISQLARFGTAHRWQGDDAGRCPGTSLAPGLLLQHRVLQALAEADHARVWVGAVLLAVERRRVAGHGVVRLPRCSWRRLVLPAGRLCAQGLCLHVHHRQ